MVSQCGYILFLELSFELTTNHLRYGLGECVIKLSCEKMYNVLVFVCLQAEMQRFTAKIVDLMKQEKLYASQGGPIILSQVCSVKNFCSHY